MSEQVNPVPISEEDPFRPGQPRRRRRTSKRSKSRKRWKKIKSYFKLKKSGQNLVLLLLFLFFIVAVGYIISEQNKGIKRRWEKTGPGGNRIVGGRG
jgi:hypothetical protein